MYITSQEVELEHLHLHCFSSVNVYSNVRLITFVLEKAVKLRL